MAGVQAVPGVPQAQVQVELEAEKLGHLPPSKARRIVACLKRSEQMWSELSRGLGPESEQYLPVLKSCVLDDLQHQPCKQKLALYQEIFGMSTKELRTVAEVFSPNRFIPRAHRHGLNGGKAFDIVLGQDLHSTRGTRSRDQLYQASSSWTLCSLSSLWSIFAVEQTQQAHSGAGHVSHEALP